MNTGVKLQKTNTYHKSLSRYGDYLLTATINHAFILYIQKKLFIIYCRGHVMKKIQAVLFTSLLFFAAGALHADDVFIGLTSGYAFSDHGYINDLPPETSRHGFAAGIDFWGGNRIQLGFDLNFLNVYRYNGSDTAYNDVNLYMMQFMFLFRLRLVRGFYIGGGTGYQIALVKPKISGTEAPEIGDDGLVALFLTGYDFRVTRNIYISPGFRIAWGFEQHHVFTSYMPVVSVLYKI